MVISPKRNQEQYGMRGITGVRPSDRVTRFERTYGTRSVDQPGPLGRQRRDHHPRLGGQRGRPRVRHSGGNPVRR